ncbi:MarR family winged helix-turn-helix transcriptional regulator [Clostridium hydrogenum]|uniref:MarR family winged helix-turn-helix transcriptional regulator n=1 Tax=Clostridium hydrogenum TaxID=2855764 RepID=UPI001F20D76F|nr:MarR family transcriptional regulator [Clostridium hydrogenum]
MDFRSMAEELFECMRYLEKGPMIKKVDNVSRGEMAVLGFLIMEHDNATAGEISERFKVTTARIANTLNSLEKKKFIERHADPDDRRKVIVHVTGEGRTAAENKYNEAVNGLKEMLMDLGEKDAVEHVRITKRIANLIKKKQKEFQRD